MKVSSLERRKQDDRVRQRSHAAYRPDGMKAYKSNGTTTTYFICDQNGAPVQEIVGGSVSAVNTVGHPPP